MAEPARRRASYEDVLNAPPNHVAQVLEGELYLHPRPSTPHVVAAIELAALWGKRQ